MTLVAWIVTIRVSEQRCILEWLVPVSVGGPRSALSKGVG